jgi:hypothetical protein
VIFLCFSSGERYTAVKSCLYHLKNFGMPVWYDYHELILGDNKKEKNFRNAINQCVYFIIIYSHNFFKSPCAMNEEELIFSELKNRSITIFPLLYNIKFDELPNKQKSRLENIIYNEISNKCGCLLSVNQIISKIFIDKLGRSSLDITPKIEIEYANKTNDKFIKSILNAYIQLAYDNFDTRISILYCLYKYMIAVSSDYEYPDYIIKAMDYLFTTSKLHIPLNHEEIIIGELSLMLMWKINGLVPLE